MASAVGYHNRLELFGVGSACQCRSCWRCEFDSWVGRIPWQKKWQPIPIFLPGKSHGQGRLGGYSPRGSRESDTTEHACIFGVGGRPILLRHVSQLQNTVECQADKTDVYWTLFNLGIRWDVNKCDWCIIIKCDPAVLQMWLAKTRWYWSWMGPYPVWLVSLQEDRHTGAKTHRVNASDEAGRDWSDAATSQRMLEMAGKPPAARRGKEGSFSVFQGSLSPADTLIQFLGWEDQPCLISPADTS